MTKFRDAVATIVAGIVVVSWCAPPIIGLFTGGFVGEIVMAWGRTTPLAIASAGYLSISRSKNLRHKLAKILRLMIRGLEDWELEEENEETDE